jgi:hypothetical protein
MTVTLIVYRRAGIGQLVRTPVLRGVKNSIASHEICGDPWLARKRLLPAGMTALPTSISETGPRSTD